MAKSRARPAAVEDSAIPPPAKRRKPLSNARNDGLDDILLANSANKKLAPAHTTRLNRSSASRVNDEATVVITPNGHTDVVGSRSGRADIETVDISSDQSSDDSDDEEDSEEDAKQPTVNKKVNGVINGVSHDEDEGQSEGESDRIEEADQDAPAGLDEEATFGERLAAQHADPIDVEAALAQAEGEASDAAPKAKRLAPTGATFSTVLTQALRTNDSALLESCFETADLESVRNTLSRIDSRLVVALMQKMAEKISRRPGRLGNLMVWIQWVIIAHGGYLAGQPDIVKQLATLQRVIKARADGLQPLLQLKGKLDMLSAQMDLRRDMQERNARNEEDDEEAVTIYVEGEEDEDLNVSDEGSEDAGDEQRLLLKGFGGAEAGDPDDEGDVDQGTFRNGVVKGDGEASDGSDAEEGLFDDEAEETDGDEEDDSESGDDEAASDDEDSD